MKDLIDKLHRRLSSGVCKERQCIIYVTKQGPNIHQCKDCEAPEQLNKESVDE